MIQHTVLKTRFKSSLRYSILIGLVGLVVIGFTIYDLITGSNDLTMRIFDYVLISFASLVFLFNLYMVIILLIDLKNLNNNIVETMDVKFVRFLKLTKNKSNVVSYSGQVFRNLENNQELSLDISAVEHNGRYKVIFGKYSKLGIPLSKLK